MLFTRFDPFLQCADRNTDRSANTDRWQLSGCNQLKDFCASYPKRLCCLGYVQEEPLWCNFLRISSRICLSSLGRHIPTYAFAFCIELHDRSHDLSGVVVENIHPANCCTVAVQTISLPMTHSAQAACIDASAEIGVRTFDGNSAYGIRTRDLRLERAASLATRRMRRTLLSVLILRVYCPFVNSFDGLKAFRAKRLARPEMRM